MQKVNSDDFPDRTQSCIIAELRLTCENEKCCVLWMSFISLKIGLKMRCTVAI